MVHQDAFRDALTARRIVIIGGGWAGLSAATRLQELGAEPILIDRGKVLGGRSSSFREEKIGEWLDHGSHLFIGAYREALRLLELWGSHHQIVFQPGFEIPWLMPKGRRECLRLGNTSTDALSGILSFGAISLLDRTRLIKRLKRASSYDFENGKNNPTIAEVIGVDEKTSSRLREFFQALSLAVMNAPIEIAAAEPLAFAMRDGLLGGGERARIGLPKVSLYEIIGSPAQKYLASKSVVLHLGKSVNQVTTSGNGRFSITFGDSSLQADSVILAVPPNELGRLLPKEWIAKLFPIRLDRFDFAPIIGCHFLFDQPVLDVPFGYLSGGFGHWVFGRGVRDKEGWKKVSVVISYAPGREEVKPAEIIEAVFGDLKERLPEVAKAKLLFGRAVRTARATIVVTPEVNRIRPSESTPVPGLFLAGDWCATGLPATIESAARSGRTAAELALAEIRK